MIINENNKNTILKGTVKRGFNQDPAELRAKLNPNAGKINIQTNDTKLTEQINKGLIDNGKLKESFNIFNKLK